MRIDSHVICTTFPCTDVNQDVYQIPQIDLDPQSIRVMVISEAVPPNPANYYYALGNPSYEKTTLAAFRTAGFPAKTLQDLVNQGVYFTSAIKCAKTAYGVQIDTIKECANLLEKELALFPNLKAILLMGEVAIKALNSISLRKHKQRVTPDQPTYQIRNWKFTFQDIRVFPSYLQVGPSFNHEKSKHRMIVEDIAAAMKVAEISA
jgi:hypothetical protein